jgi:uncharacterized membrane protein (UPF0127 family)
MPRIHLARATLLLALLAGCADEEPPAPAADVDAAPIVAFDTTRIQIITETDTIPLRVEVAATGEQRAMGLMERQQLPTDAGMLFTYPATQPAEAGFWMFRTRIPLDIAFVDESGRIVAIRAMEPCASPDPRWCPTYEPGAPYRTALEVSRGWFQERGVDVGDQVLVPEGAVAGAE